MNLNKEHYDRRRLSRKNKRSNTAEPPRTRSGQKFPGGKHMRKALARLAARQSAYVADKAGALDRNPNLGDGFTTKPGSMKA